MLYHVYGSSKCAVPPVPSPHLQLLIMDSIMNNLRSDFCGRGELAERQQRLGQLMARLRKVRSRGGRQAGQRRTFVGPAMQCNAMRVCVLCGTALHTASPLPQQVSEEFNVAVVITNQASSVPCTMCV